MAPQRKETCDCGHLENASKEPDHPIRFNTRMNEYYLSLKNGGQMMIYYCPFCGGRTPESRRSSFFAHVTQEEEMRIYKLFEGIRNVTDTIAKFGPPDEEQEFGSAVRTKEHDSKPSRGEVFRTMIYKKLSPVADVYFEIGTNNSVSGSWIQKHL
jgi:Domain of unknown function (DUF6980)